MKTDHSPASYEVNDQQAGVVRDVYRLFTEESMSINGIVRHLKQQAIVTSKGKSRWGRSAIWGILRNPAYKGTAYYGKCQKVQGQRVNRPPRQKGAIAPPRDSKRPTPPDQWIPIPVPAIISEETFELAHELLERNKRLSRRNTKVTSILQSLLVCHQCGYALYRSCSNTTKGKLYYYRCPSRDNSRYEHKRICENTPIRRDYLDELVWQHVIGLLCNPELIGEEIQRRHQKASNSQGMQRKRETLLKEAEHVTRGMNKLLDAYQEVLCRH